MAQGKQAKRLADAQVSQCLTSFISSPTWFRDTTMVLLSHRQALRSMEIAGLKWSMVLDAGGGLARDISIPDAATKGKCGGGDIPIARELRVWLWCLWMEGHGPDDAVIQSMRGSHFTANSVVHWFDRLYKSQGLIGCSSHSGRRTAITRWARAIPAAGGSMRDVQALARHSSLLVTQRYCDVDEGACRRVVDL